MTPRSGSCRLADLAKPALADNRAGETEERDVDVCAPLVADEQPFELV
jgi:hypothetical protein